MALVNEANAFMRRAWRSEAALSLQQELHMAVDPGWAAACSANLYYRQSSALQQDRMRSASE